VIDAEAAASTAETLNARSYTAAVAETAPTAPPEIRGGVRICTAWNVRIHGHANADLPAAYAPASPSGMHCGLSGLAILKPSILTGSQEALTFKPLGRPDILRGSYG